MNNSLIFENPLSHLCCQKCVCDNTLMSGKKPFYGLEPENLGLRKTMGKN